MQPLKLGRFLFYLGFILVLFGASSALAELATIPATEYTWTAPKSGTPVDHYLVQVRVNNNELREYDFIPHESIYLQHEYGVKYEVRVAGIDADGNRGGFSPWSQAYSPELAPPGF